VGGMAVRNLNLLAVEAMMELQEYIALLEQHPREKRLAKGLGNPHSWRGVYAELAFEVVEDTTVGEMLDCAEDSVGKTFEGWKGGDFKMCETTEIHIELEEGAYSDSATLMNWFFELLLSDS